VSTLAIPYTPVSPPLATSGDGVLRHVRDLLVVLGGCCSTQSTTATTNTIAFPELISSTQTNSGLVVKFPVAAQAAVIAELRQRSGLTWEQLARLFGVARRSVHFWASGKAMNASNAVRLNELLRTARYIDRGGSGLTRLALMSAQPNGAIPFDLLVEGRFADVMALLGRGRGYDADARSRLLGAQSLLWTPPSPDRLVGAFHETVHTSHGRARAGRSAKVKKTP
jgi:DNA-binding transcriptional regulator YiaG